MSKKRELETKRQVWKGGERKEECEVEGGKVSGGGEEL